MAAKPKIYVQTLSIAFSSLIKGLEPTSISNKKEYQKMFGEFPFRYRVSSSVDCHHYHTDTLLTEQDLDRIKAEGIVIHVDRKTGW